MKTQVRVTDIRQIRREVGAARLDPPDAIPLPTRPRTRGGCIHARPCPFLSCKYHLAFDITCNGGIRINVRRGIAPDKMTPSCVLDVAEQGWHTLEEIGDILGITREAIRQIEGLAFRKLRHSPEGLALLRELVK